MIDVYHHLEFPRTVCRAVRRALGPDGRFCVIDFHRDPARIQSHPAEWVMGHLRADQVCAPQPHGIRSGVRAHFQAPQPHERATRARDRRAFAFPTVRFASTPHPPTRARRRLPMSKRCHGTTTPGAGRRRSAARCSSAASRSSRSRTSRGSKRTTSWSSSRSRSTSRRRASAGAAPTTRDSSPGNREQEARSLPLRGRSPSHGAHGAAKRVRGRCVSGSRREKKRKPWAGMGMGAGGFAWRPL